MNDELADLRHHWDTAYKISLDRGRWLAARRDTGETLTASTASELRERIRADYSRRPVPRKA
jgi:hypothetical protein